MYNCTLYMCKRKYLPESKNWVTFNAFKKYKGPFIDDIIQAEIIPGIYIENLNYKQVAFV